jgi:hypothetical protein
MTWPSAIPSALAQDVVATLTEGQDVESLGINGVAWYDEEVDVGGIWVSGVRAGSAASNAGVRAGDILLRLAGRDVVVGTTEPDEDSGNGGDADRTVPNGFRLVTDSTGRLTTVMPEGWQDFSQGRLDTEIGTASGMALSPDNANFLEGDGSAPGVLMVIYEDLGRSDLRDVRNFLARSVGVTDACIDQGGENEPTEFQTRYETLIYVDRNYGDCFGTSLQAYVAAMWFPDAEAFVGYVATYQTAKQMENEDTILLNIDTN